MKKKRMIVLAGIGFFCIAFMILLTYSFFDHVLKQIGVDNAENSHEYNRHYVMLVDNMESNFWQDVYACIRDEAANVNAYVEFKGKSLTSEYDMVDYMDMSIAAGVDGIWLEYTGEVGLMEKIDEAVSGGIPVITILNDAPVSKRSSYVGINTYQLGQDYANEILDIIPNDTETYKISVLLRNHEPNSSQAQIFSQIYNRITMLEQTSGRVVVEEINIPSGRAFESEEIVWELFQSEAEQPDMIVCLNEVDTDTVYQALIDYNRIGKTQLIGYYTSDTALDAVRKGTMSKTLYIDIREMGKFSIQAMTECLSDGRTNSFYSVDLHFVSQSDVSQYRKRE